MNSNQLLFMRKMIYALETGGQVYGNQNYSDFTQPYTNSSSLSDQSGERAITIGAGQWYGPEAKRLLNLIKSKYKSVFNKYDANGVIGGDLNSSDWSNYQLYKNKEKDAAKIKIIVSIISSPEGIKCQDELMDTQIKEMITKAENLGITDTALQAMVVQNIHLGGTKAVQRVLNKTNKPYTLKNFKAALSTDTGNQIGAYRDRQDAAYNMIISKFPEDNLIIKPIEYSNNNYGGKNMISNSGHDENGRYSGGKAGDQGGEWTIREWYSRPWNVVLRHPDANKRELIAKLAEEAARNDLIGYDQNERTTFWYHLMASGYRPSQITIKCEADCSAGVAAICKAVGYLTNDDKMSRISIDAYTGNLKSVLTNAGFTAYTSSKYTSSPDYLLRGDILLCEGHHTATNLTNGSKASASSTTTTTTSSSSTGSNLNEKPKWVGKVTASTLSVRTWAGTENPTIKSWPMLTRGNLIDVCDSVKDKTGATWYFVKIAGRFFGFVHSAYVQRA